VNPATIIAVGCLCLIALGLVFAVTANLTPEEPSYPPGEHRVEGALALLACALTFCAGLLL
jgi:hypothetical protein